MCVDTNAIYVKFGAVVFSQLCHQKSSNINCFVLIFTFCLGNLKNQKVSETKEKMKR